ncbi:hypothetical protein [Streptomyces sp. NPDC058612]|uniref:hypothetical protein n=1 Tax=Streptomyces sp. NPDC058612 TaxID=3346555 RepID=UPI00365BF4A3
MPGTDKPTSDDPEDDGSPAVRGESRSTVRDVLVVGVAQALLAGLAEETAHWIHQCLVWLYEMLVSHL